MKFRPSTALAVALAAAAVLAPLAAGASNGLHLRPTGGAKFPDRAYVLSLSANTYLTADSVVVRENGRVMKDVTVVPASAAEAGQFGVVLVIDASESMHGEAIQSALQAAQAFAAERQAEQAIAVVTFNSTTQLLLPLSTDSGAIGSALARPPALALQTHAYDAIDYAVSLLEKSDITVRNIVVLSDGADTGSTHSLEDVAAAAREAGVRIFTVGLHSGAFNPDALEKLARDGGGEFSEARTPADLKPIFTALGAKLASEYLIRYRSPARPGRKIIVSVAVAGYPGNVTAGYTSPSVTGAPEGIFQRSILDRFVLSSLGMVVTALAAGFLAAMVFLLLIHPRRHSIRRRLGEFVSLAEVEEQAAAAKRPLPFERAEQSFKGARWWSRFKNDLEVARIEMSPSRILIWTAIATAVAVYLLAMLVGPLAGLLGFGVPFVTRAVVHHKLDRQRRLFSEQLPDNLQVLASALRAGHSLIGALSVVVDDAPEPSRSEFRRVVADEQLGVRIEDALEVVAERMESKDVKQVALVAALQHETGGNTAEVLDRVAETVRERFELRRLVKTLTAQGRLTRWILTGLPVFLLIAITVLNPKYMRPLYTHPTGRVLLVVAAVMVISGSLVIRRIINIKV